ncbi:hypothetical protein CsSME_00009894 [Camellia sinensis var. sinensis]
MLLCPYIIGLWIYGTTKGMNRKPTWKVVECPQQSTRMECGFCVRRYVKDLIRDQGILTKTNFNGKTTYMEPYHCMWSGLTSP